MTYPAARFRGDAGETSATIRRSDAPHDLTWAGGTTADFLATSASTGGLFGVYRWTMPPSASGAAPHFHRTIAESFFVLVGTVKIFDGRAWLDAAPGDFVHVPPGGVHGFRNDADAVAQMLIHFAPGAPREAYFEGLVRWSFEGRPDEAEASEFFRHHDNHYV